MKGVEPAPTTPAPPYKLFSIRHIGVAAFLGSALAAGGLMAINFARLGRPSAARLAIVIGTLATVALLTIAFYVPDSFPNTAIPVVTVVASLFIAKNVMGERISFHEASGGEAASGWSVFGVSIASLAIIGGLLICGFVLIEMQKERVEVTGGEIYVEEGATKADANKLADALLELGYLEKGREAAVVIGVDEDRYVIGFVVVDGIWDDSSAADAFKEVGAALETPMGKPIVVQLVDEGLEVRKVLEPS